MYQTLFRKKYVINRPSTFRKNLQESAAFYDIDAQDARRRFHPYTDPLDKIEDKYWLLFVDFLVLYCTRSGKKIKISLVDADTPESDWRIAARESEAELLRCPRDYSLSDDREPVPDLQTVHSDCKKLRQNNILFYSLSDYTSLFVKWRLEKNISIDEIAYCLDKPIRVIESLEDEHVMMTPRIFCHLCYFYKKKMFIEIV